MCARVLADESASVEMDDRVVVTLRVLHADGLVMQHSYLHMRAYVVPFLSQVKLQVFCFDRLAILLLKLCKLLIGH